MFVESVYRHAGERPDAVAVVRNGESFSYARFAAMLAASMRFFEQFQLARGRTAVLVMDNLLSCWLAVGGLRALGVDTIVVASAEQIAALGLTDVCCLVYAASEPGKPHAPVGPGQRLITFPDVFIVRGPELAAELPMPVAEPGGHYIYTSGTTGRYKLLLSPGNLSETNAPAVAALYGLGLDVRFGAIFFPLYTGAAMVSVASWMYGATVVLDQRPDALLRLMSEPVDVCMLVPAMLEGLLRALQASSRPPASFRLLTIGGAVSAALAEQVASRVTPHIEVQYGSSECGALARSHYRTPDDLIWLTPEDGRDLRIFNAEGAECAPDDEGELAVRLTERDRDHYVNDPETTARFFRDGYFYPGDMAVRRADGRIRILGRVADVINIMGFKRAVAPFEEDLRRLLGAREVCLFGWMSAAGEEMLAVAIEADSEPAAEQVAAIRSKFPRRQVLVRVFPQFPRGATAMQKVDRRALRRLVIGDAG